MTFFSASQLIKSFDEYQEDDFYDEYYDEIQAGIEDEERIINEEKNFVKYVIEENLKQKLCFMKYHDCKKRFHCKFERMKCENCQILYEDYHYDCMIADHIDEFGEYYTENSDTEEQ
jgi:hypothetical protein